MPGQKKRRTAGSVIASVFLSILLLAPLTLGVFWWELRDILSQKGIEYCLDSIKPEEIKISGAGTGRGETLLDRMADSVNKVFGSKKVTADDMKEMIDGSTAKAFIAREAGDIFEDLKNGTSRASVTAEELSAFVEENWHLFEGLLPSVPEEDLALAVDTVVAGEVDPGFAETVRDYLKKHDPSKKYDGMIRTFQATGAVEEKDRDLLTEFLTKELFPGMYRDEIAKKLTDEVTGKLSTAYLRSEMEDEGEKIVGTAFSALPGYAAIGIIAVLVLLYFVADRHIPGDAFIGIGALLLTVCGPLAAAGVLHPLDKIFRRYLTEGEYLARSVSNAFLGFHQTRNLTAAVIGLCLVILGLVLNGLSRRRIREADPFGQA